MACVIPEEISLKQRKRWIDKDGKQRQMTRRFFQTIKPSNTDRDGMIKNRFQIESELKRDARRWLAKVEV